MNLSYFLFNLFYKENNLGLKGPDIRDERDILATEFIDTMSLEELPKEFNLMSKMTSIQSQLYGSCTSHSVDGVKEYQESKEEGREIKLANRFIYHNIKKISGLWNDEGDYLRNGPKALEKYGVPLEEDFPDVPEANWNEYVTKEPSSEVYDKALKYKAQGYIRVPLSLENFRSAAYKNDTPICCGMRWHKSYRPDSDGRLPAPINESGGHAISYIGWTEGKEWFRNSWGVSWGFNGYFYIPTNEFSHHDFWDGWTLFDLPNSWRDKSKTMHQRYIKDNEQYFKHDEVYWHIPEDVVLKYLLDRQWVTKNILPLPENITVKEMPLSIRAYEYVKSGHEVFEDLFGN